MHRVLADTGAGTVGENGGYPTVDTATFVNTVEGPTTTPAPTPTTDEPTTDVPTTPVPTPGDPAVVDFGTETVIEGRPWNPDEEFPIVITPTGPHADDAPMPDEDTIHANDGDKVPGFGDIVFDRPGEWTYEVTQQTPEDDDADYSEAVYEVTVTVTEDADGNLHAEVERVKVIDDAGNEVHEVLEPGDEKALFVHRYTPPSEQPRDPETTPATESPSTTEAPGTEVPLAPKSPDASAADPDASAVPSDGDRTDSDSVTGSGDDTGSGPLPWTGADVAPYLVLGVLLLAVGIGLSWLGRKQRR